MKSISGRNFFDLDGQEKNIKTTVGKFPALGTKVKLSERGSWKR